MHLKIGYTFLALSIFFIVIFGIDKATSENPSNGALIRIGLSDTDSSQCKICQEGEIYFESGCKRCQQDGIVLTAHVSNERFYSIGWSNDNGMYYGDQNCDGIEKTKNVIANENSTYYIEISKNDLLLETKFYEDRNFSKLNESVSIQMCSNPSDLQFIRITNEDGKPSGNGGKISGLIDEIMILEKNNDKSSPIFSTSFDDCIDNFCENVWKFHNPEKIFVDTKTDSLSFLSEVSGTHDYAHLKLNEKLPNSWTMKFIFHIDDIEEHPRGKGILNIDPILCQILFGIPAIFLPLIGYVITRNSKSIFFGITMIIIGISILGGTLFNSYQNFSLELENSTELIPLFNTNLSLVIIAISILIIILGIIRMNVSNKKEFPN